MGNPFEDEEDAFDLAAVEARHAEMEAEARLEAEAERQKKWQETDKARDTSDTLAASGNYPESDWEAIIEAVLFTMGNSVELRQLAIAIGQSEKVAWRVTKNLQQRYEKENRGMQILELEDAFQMSTRGRFYENLILVASAPKKHVLTEVMLETLSIIAYKQPVTKLEISKIRGVSSDHAVNRLVEYELVKEVGRLDAPGRPALFATTEEFLRRFGIGAVVDLPSMNPEQEEEIIQAVEEELQLKLTGQGEILDVENARENPGFSGAGTEEEAGFALT